MSVQCAKNTRNIALRLAYDGTNYHGWQEQSNLPTVAQTLRKAIEAVVGSRINLIGCGRTDTGVHAETYVANFQTSSSIPTDRIPYAINTKLPSDISVYEAAEVPLSFHSVFSSTKKEYTYVIYCNRVKNPFYHNRAMFYPKPLDIEIMRRAAAEFLGEHDFRAFRSVGSNVKTTVRTLFSFDVDVEGELVKLRVSANGFLYNMARTLVGTLLYVSEGKITPEDIRGIFESGERMNAGPTVPACGLYMTDVLYNIPVF
ncbi:MAG: tRNA pseudouridine(38-40) synthase TruA [Clostridiales bacterium]|nr:tRNA pseudouridine(38-40) synthase TruA [Clostridiales bacterium]